MTRLPKGKAKLEEELEAAKIARDAESDNELYNELGFAVVDSAELTPEQAEVA